MHWGHSISKDLMHWEHLAPAIVRDTLGHIFSGSSIVDQENVAGYGTGTILAFYTSASDKNGQIQCLAYSNDNGRTFTKYDKNPILRSSDRRKDFRDPKVFWYAPGNKWIMIVAADKETCPQRAIAFGPIDELRKQYGKVDAVAPLPEPSTKPNLVLRLPKRGSQPVGSTQGTVY